MSDDTKTREELLGEIEHLRIRLEEAEEMIRAIRAGEVDGLVVSGPEGDRLFLLKGAGHAYRVFVEAMNEGAVTLSHDGTIIYCNDRFAEMLDTTHQKVMGSSIYQCIAAADEFDAAFERGKSGKKKLEALLMRKDKEPLPVYLSLTPLLDDEAPAICAVVTDLEALKQSERQRRQLASRLLAAHEEERKRIAGDIHDGLGSSLSHIRMVTELVSEKIEEEYGPEIADQVKMVIHLVHECIDECRRLQMDLRPALLDDLGILATLSWFCRRWQTIYPGIRIEQKIGIKEDEVPDLLKTVIFRITQEALNNVAKHSSATLISLSLVGEGGKIKLAISDNGVGFNADTMPTRGDSPRGLGLESMRERAELSGGTFTVQTTPGQGAVIRAFWSTT
jgi:PAS domain S-box-containing protein